MKTLKITFISYLKLTYYGGEQKWIIDIANELVDRGYDVCVITPSANIAGEKERISNEILQSMIKFKYIKNNMFFIKYKGFREYFTVSNTDFLYVADFWSSIFQPFLTPRVERIIMGNHGLLFSKDFKGQKIKLHILKKLSNILNSYDNLYIHVLNTKQKEFYKKLNYKNVVMLQNFIRYNKYNFPKISPVFSILFLGRLVEQKGVDILPRIIEYVLRNINKPGKIVFLIAGSGNPKYEILIKNLESKYPNNVRYLGFISEKEKIRLLSFSNLFLVPSRFEGQPISVLEALASGCPFLGSNIVALNDLINIYDSNFGWIVDKYDPKYFANKIVDLYNLWECNQDYYYKKRQYIRKKSRIFDIKSVIDLFVKYFLKYA